VFLDMADQQGVGFATIDPQRIAEVRARLPAIDHRRPIPEVTTL
jgi:deaminated glutathione amidase